MTAAPAIGNLPWRPARDRPDLLAGPVASALPPSTWVAPIDADLADTAAFCAAYAVPLEASANCVIVAGRRAEAIATAACVVLATDRADVNRAVRKHLGVRKISFATMTDAVEQTAMEYGGITPLGLPGDWPLLIDDAVSRREWVVIGSGLRASKIAVPGRVLAELPRAVVLPLALRSARTGESRLT